MKKFDTHLLRLLLFLAITVPFVLTSCSDEGDPTDTDTQPTAKICVFSDPHYYDPALGTSGAAFETYLAYDRKLIAESEEILKATINGILAENPDIVLIPGDLTKDGVKQCHEKFADYLKQFTDAGIKVFVVPGNHDINNPRAHSYPGDNYQEEPTVTATEFANIYKDFGYDAAIARDPNSLSYIAEPVDGLWIFGLDPCRYDENIGADHSVTGGKFKTETYNWIIDKLQEAKNKGKIPIAMMHHNLAEHFPSQQLIFADYILDNWQSTASDFAANGLKVIFTGHHHAHDISLYEDSGGKIYDIQTGATVTWPCPWRTAILNEQKMLNISSTLISDINYDTGGRDFQTYAKDKLENGFGLLIKAQLKEQFGLSDEQVDPLIPLVTSTLIAYYHGDESQMSTPEIEAGIQQLINSGDMTAQMLGGLLLGIWQDNTPDHNMIIDLNVVVP